LSLRRCHNEDAVRERGLVLSRLVAVEGEGKRLDRFELVAELASGGMATVYLARLSGVGGFQRFVAIKRLHPHLAKDAEFIQMFLDEARLAARIHHPNVVPILEIGQSADGYYLVMEYIEGDTLGRLLARSAQAQTKFPPHVGVRIVLDTLAGLHAAHELKDDDGKPLECVHRDVSPQNVLVGVDGSSRITDFGVARATSRLSTTRTGQLKGKLAYMAPEQARGLKDVDRRADVFAMGTVLWEALACKRLFKGDGEADTLNRVLHEPIPNVRSVNPEVPAALETVVTRALDRDRDKRFSSAAEFADALERAARVVGTLAAHREVAQYVDRVIGTEISAQREAVRAWLARSEPSRQDVPSVEKLVPETTKVEGKKADSVSSVSSSVVSVPPPPEPSQSRSEALPAPAPAPRRARVWPWAAAILLVGGGALYYARVNNVRPPPPAPAAVNAPPPPPASTPAPPAVTTSAPPAPPPPAPSEAASAAPSASVAPSASASARPGKPYVPPRPVVKPAEPPPTATVPDDISRNPYR
jgi:serine/threonine-protein kinase